MMSSEQRWTSVLTEMQVHLDEVGRRLEADGDASRLGTFAVPADLPPLPVACAALARDVARQHAELIGSVRERLAAQPIPATRDLPRARTADRASRYEARA